jgi:hypothetical protein
MIKYKPNCAVCKELKKNRKLLNRIYASSHYVKHSDDSLLRIAGDCKGIFSYESLKNHVKKHQFLNARDYTEKTMRHIANRAEQQVVAKNLESVLPTAVWDRFIEKGMEELEAGVMDLKAADLLKAAKDKSDYQFKKSDQQLQVMATIAHFASGENTQNERIYDTRTNTRQVIDADTGQPAADIDSWTSQSGDFYQSLAGSPAP